MPTTMRPMPAQEVEPGPERQKGRSYAGREAQRRHVADRLIGSRALRGTDAKSFRKQWPRAASFGEASQDLLATCTGEPECDPAIEIDPLEHKRERRVALRPPCIGEVLLRCVRNRTRPQEQSAPARRDDRFQRPQEPSTLVEHRYWMTWSARPSTDGGIVRPRALAVFRLMTRSNFVGCSTGRSAGFAPLRILSA